MIQTFLDMIYFLFGHSGRCFAVTIIINEMALLGRGARLLRFALAVLSSLSFSRVRLTLWHADGSHASVPFRGGATLRGVVSVL